MTTRPEQLNNAPREFAPKLQPLLRPPAVSFVAELARTLKLIDALFPLRAQHRRSLPHDVRELSLILTEERFKLKTPYWAAPRFLSAYLRYFLPWNLMRLAWLLPGLQLALQDGDMIMDCGSGPLTLPIGLWLSRPDLRNLKLDFICSDNATLPLQAGKDIFQALSGGNSPWRIQTVRSSFKYSVERVARSPRKASLIMAGNVLNEIDAGDRRPLDAMLGELAGVLRRALRPQGQIFAIEPGTRLGAKVIAHLRLHALRQGCRVLAPCTHEEECPMLHPRARFWCHFNFPVGEAPRALTSLSEAAKLIKHRASLSCLLLQTPEVARPDLDDLDDLVSMDDEDFFADDADFYDDAEADYDDDRDNEEHKNPRPENNILEQVGTQLPGRVVSGAIFLPGSPEQNMPISAPKNAPSRTPRRYGEGGAAAYITPMKFGEARGPMEGRYVCSAAGLTLVRPLRSVEGGLVELELSGGRDQRSQALLAKPVASAGEQTQENTSREKAGDRAQSRAEQGRTPKEQFSDALPRRYGKAKPKNAGPKKSGPQQDRQQARPQKINKFQGSGNK